jgi:class 3 adenylate cyclase/pimeloyl-ACP methyl ester carboxylesterase
VAPAPRTRYAAVGDADIAYQVVGDASLDLLFFGGLGYHVDLVWDDPVLSALLARLASFSRLIHFDRRGTGASDGVPGNAYPTWEEWTEDVLAVLDAACSERAAIFSHADAGPIAILFTVAHPERVSALVLASSTAQFLAAEDYPGVPPEALEGLKPFIESQWGTPELVRMSDPSGANDAEYLNAVAKRLRASATPRTAAAQMDYIVRSLDVRHVLPLVQVPTLVLHSEGALIPIDQGRYLAEHITGATFVTLPGGDLGGLPNSIRIADEVAEFLTGRGPGVEVERILTTVLFSDIVGSTEHAAALGDQRWRSLLDRHDNAVRDTLTRFRGREVNTTGDGFVASFDGPARAIRCAQAMVEAIEHLGIELRVGLHSGECEVRGDDLGGLAVHIAARVAALAAPGEVLVSGTVKDLVVGSGIGFTNRGERELRGVPGTWKLFAVLD